MPLPHSQAHQQQRPAASDSAPRMPMPESSSMPSLLDFPGALSHSRSSSEASGRADLVFDLQPRRSQNQIGSQQCADQGDFS